MTGTLHPVEVRRQGLTLSWPGMFLCVLCAIGISLKWLKLNTLLHMDPAWWLREAGRMGMGEMPYRDYYWPYGPLSIAAVGYPMRWFGVRFDVAQITIDVMSVAIVFLFYRLAVRILPQALSIATVILFVSISITVTTYFSLFSLISYAPAVHVAAIGLLMFLLGGVQHLQTGRIESKNIGLIVAGAWIACLAKQESLLASVVGIASLAVLDAPLAFANRSRAAWLRHYAVLSLTCFVPPALVYVALIRIVGWPKLSGCLQGYGLASIACPWWPTGYGLFGGAAALGAAAFIAGCASLLKPREWWSRFGTRLIWLWSAAILGVLAYIGFERQNLSELFFGANSFSQRVNQYGPALLSTSSFLRPVLWASMVWCAYLMWHWLVKGKRSSDAAVDLLVLIIPIVMSVRSLFGTILLPFLEVPAISYPFLILLAPYLLFRLLSLAESRLNPSAVPVWATMAFIGAYSLARIVGGHSLLWGGYPTLETAAGPVRLAEAATEGPIYSYVVEHAGPNGAILEIPFGGGFAFAAHLRNPSYSTLFFQLKPPDWVQQEDRRRIEAARPGVVIGRAREPRLGTLLGTAGTMGCTLPSIAWVPNRPSNDPDHVFPFYEYLQANYRPDREFGEWVAWIPAR